MSEIKMPNDPIADALRAQYPSNSIMSKTEPAEPEKLEAVVTDAIIMKDGLGTKIKKLLLPGDLRDIRDYALRSVVIPGLKGLALAIVEIALYGKASRRGYGDSYVPPYSGSSYTYGSNRVDRSVGSGQRSSPQPSQADRSMHNFQWVRFKTYDDAANVADALIDQIDRKGYVTVAEYYTLVGVRPDWVEDRWGWRSFKKLDPKPVRDGYILEMEKPILLTK